MIISKYLGFRKAEKNHTVFFYGNPLAGRYNKGHKTKHQQQNDRFSQKHFSPPGVKAK